MDFYEAVRRRQSVRSFSPNPVPLEVLTRALTAAGRAPSPLNSQPWRFTVLEGQARGKLGSLLAGSSRLLEDLFPLLTPEHLEAAARFLSDLGGAPQVIVLTVPRFEDDYDRDTARLAAGAAMVILELALAVEGVGSVSVTSARWVEDRLLTDLGLADQEVATIIPVGYPSAEPPVRERRNDLVRWLSLWP